MDTGIGKWKVLNRDVIKYIAMFTMLLNHISNVFLERGTFLGELFLDIGYFTAPVMCYFLVEGYQYTRSKEKYGLRLFVFALLSEIPFCLAFSHGAVIQFYGLNMLFTLLCCFLILVVKENVENNGLKFVLYALLILATVICDWPVMAAVYTIFFAYSKDSRKNMTAAYMGALVIFAFMMYMSNSFLYPAGEAIWMTAGACLGFACAPAVILCFYNGKRAETGRTFSKWFFYIFYPGHLLILGLLRIYFEL